MWTGRERHGDALDQVPAGTPARSLSCLLPAPEGRGDHSMRTLCLPTLPPAHPDGGPATVPALSGERRGANPARSDPSAPGCPRRDLLRGARRENLFLLRDRCGAALRVLPGEPRPPGAHRGVPGRSHPTLQGKELSCCFEAGRMGTCLPRVGEGKGMEVC